MTDQAALVWFGDCLDAHGADIGRWPDALSQDAGRLLAASPEARALHAEARRMAALVAEAARSDTPNGLAFRLVAGVAARRRDRLSVFAASPRRFGLAGASFCAAALAVGVILGSLVGPSGAAMAGLDLGVAVELALTDGDL